MRRSSLSAWKANPRNPRTITDDQLAALKKAMIEFGDLSGLIVNERTGNMIGGHQRVKILGALPVTILRRYKTPTARGTVAEGFVEYLGERFVYREVSWTDRQEQTAMIAANKHGGDFDLELVSDLLEELRAESLDMELTGFSDAELVRLLDNIAAGSTTPRSGDSDDLRTIQLMLTTETLPVFMEKAQKLEAIFETRSLSDTICRAVDECYRSHYGDDKDATGAVLAAHSKQRTKS